MHQSSEALLRLFCGRRSGLSQTSQHTIYRRQHDRQSHTFAGLGVATALHHRLLNSGLDRLEADGQQESSLRRRGFPEDVVQSEMAALDRAIQSRLGEYV